MAREQSDLTGRPSKDARVSNGYEFRAAGERRMRKEEFWLGIVIVVIGVILIACVLFSAGFL